MRIEILSEAEDDLVAGAKFYERRRALKATTRGSSPVRAARLLLPLTAAALARKGLRPAL